MIKVVDKIRPYFVHIVVLLILLGSSGCRTVQHYSKFKKAGPLLEIKKVAVLPFINESGRMIAGEVVTNIFILGVFKTGQFIVEEKGNVDQFLFREKVRDVRKIRVETLQKLGRRLGIDGVFVGIVEEFTGGRRGKSLATPGVAIRVRLVDTKTGQIVWMAKNQRSGADYTKIFNYGAISTVELLTKQVVLETLDTILEN